MAKDTKERILMTALDMFSKKGYEGTNIRELAELPDVYDFDQAFSSLFAWCQKTFARIEYLGGK